MYWNQRIGSVILLRWFTGHNEEFELGSILVATVGILPSSELAVGQADRTCTLVAVVLAILAGDIGQGTGITHILERVMQKSV